MLPVTIDLKRIPPPTTIFPEHLPPPTPVMFFIQKIVAFSFHSCDLQHKQQ